MLAEQATARMQAMHALVGELARSAPASDEVMQELARVEGRQGDAARQAEALEAKLAELAAGPERIDALQSKATLIELLEAVRTNLATVNEQKAMVDRLNERLANVQFVIQEAHQTLQMLNQERELVERLDDSIRQLHKGTRP
jgi:DNA repair exonuclease SbcCD ATPase subunit